tara:strand:+ start:202 stop:522 length:321 start_codon:yes stop_codon:yes gene_type:complete
MIDLKKLYLEPLAGLVLTILSSLGFFIMCMILPLVGPAGSSVEHSYENKKIFFVVLIINIILSFSSYMVKMMQSKRFGFPKPIFSLFLSISSLFFLIVFLFDGFSI